MILLKTVKRKKKKKKGKKTNPEREGEKGETASDPEDKPNDDSSSKEKKHNLPTEGEPNSDQTIENEDGSPKQTRHYGPDGKAEYDIDYNHPGKNHEFPHKHTWDWSKNPPRQSSQPMTQ